MKTGDKIKLSPLGWYTLGLFSLYTIFFFSGEYTSVKEWLKDFSFTYIIGVFGFFLGKIKWQNNGNNSF